MKASLLSLGLVKSEDDHVYHDPAWWREWLADRGLPIWQVAEEAGIRIGRAVRLAESFGFAALARYGRRKPRFPDLHSREPLRALLRRNRGCYAAAAREIGSCSESVRKQALALLGEAEVQRLSEASAMAPHSEPSWWEERVRQGATPADLAEQSGLSEESTLEHLRGLNLLDQAWVNVSVRERRNRPGRTGRAA